MRRLIQIALALGFFGVLLGVAGGALVWALILRDLPEIQSLRDYKPNLITRVLDVDGNEIASLARERRVIVPIEAVPKHVVDAFVAAEDGSFYEHEGLDYSGIIRAAWTNLVAGGTKVGGSTITQQVAKTFLLDSERTYTRKLKDMILARRIEQALSKNDILYLYLNQIYLGAGAYGIEAAAETYFGKHASELQVHEAALIAGIIPRPSLWSPRRDPVTAKNKQKLVLRRMMDRGLLSPEEGATWAEQPLVYAEPRWQERDSACAFFVEEVRRHLVAVYGEDEVLTGGLTVHTTLDAVRQLGAWRAVREGLREHDRRTGYRGPVRKVAQADWPTARSEIGAANEAVVPGEDDVIEALVIAVDDAKQVITLALGPEETATTTLGLADVAWAGKPDPAIDGLYPRVKKVGEALRPGEVVKLERLPLEKGATETAGYRYALYQHPQAEGALIAIDPTSGRLHAVVGGYSFAQSQFDRALQSRRQPGSAFKPVVYAAALVRGYTPATIVHDTAIVYEDATRGFDWKPENYDEDYAGPITLRTALAKSRNAATIRILSDIGLAPVHDMAKALGIASNLEMNLGLALGNSEVTLAELVRAYTPFAAGGKVIDPVYILEVRDRTGRTLERDVPLLAGAAATPAETTPPVSQGPESEQAAPSESELEKVMEELRAKAEAPTTGLGEDFELDPVDAFLMTDMLRAVVNEGTGGRVKELGRPVAGKTGTTNDLRDAWFVGYTPELVAGVWIGYDSARNLGSHETGGRTAAPIFLDFMKRALADRPVQEFSVPEGVVFARIDRASGLLATADSKNALFVPFREGSAPVEVAPTQAEQEAGRPLRLD